MGYDLEEIVARALGTETGRLVKRGDDLDSIPCGQGRYKGTWTANRIDNGRFITIA